MPPNGAAPNPNRLPYDPTEIPSLPMIGTCRWNWRRNYPWFFKSLIILTVSHGRGRAHDTILIAWFWHLIPLSSAGTEFEADLGQQPSRDWEFFPGPWRRFFLQKDCADHQEISVKLDRSTGVLEG
jgi:hypothetical protein